LTSTVRRRKKRNDALLVGPLAVLVIGLAQRASCWPRQIAISESLNSGATTRERTKIPASRASWTTLGRPSRIDPPHKAATGGRADKAATGGRAHKAATGGRAHKAATGGRART